jgi:hypothetical protein
MPRLFGAGAKANQRNKMKTTQKLLTRAFSPGTLDLFAHVGERCRENPLCWFIFGLWFLFTLFATALYVADWFGFVR